MSFSDRDSTLMTTGHFIEYALYRKRSYMRLLFPPGLSRKNARIVPSDVLGIFLTYEDRSAGSMFGLCTYWAQELL
jgi:hypothetical protein